MENRMEQLTEAVKRVRSGAEGDVEHLLSMLESHTLFLPIAKKFDPALRVVAQFRLQNFRTKEWIPVVFTDDRFLAAAGRKFGWKTDGENLQLMELSCRDALAHCLQSCDRNKECVLIDPGYESELALTSEEVFGLLQGNTKALSEHLQQLPLQAGERIAERLLTQDELPAEFDGAVRSVVRQFSDFAVIQFSSVVSAQREKPILLISIRSNENLDQEEIVGRIDVAVRDTLPKTFDSINVVFLSE